MYDIQRASIVGGIALGSVTCFLVSAGAAMVSGAVTSIVSAASSILLQPFLQKKIGLQDNFGVLSVNAIPG